MSDKPHPYKYSLEELQAYAKKNFPKDFKAVSDPDAYTIEKRRIKELDKERTTVSLLHVGHFNTSNSDLGLWASNVRQPISDDSDADAEVRLACYQGKLEARLDEIDMTDSNRTCQIRYMTPYHQVTGTERNNTARKRLLGRNRLRVFVEYVFMLKGESDGLDTKEGEDALLLFREACIIAANAATEGKKGEVDDAKSKTSSGPQNGKEKGQKRQDAADRVTRSKRKRRDEDDEEEDESYTPALRSKKKSKNAEPRVKRTFPGLKDWKQNNPAATQGGDSNDTPNSQPPEEDVEEAPANASNRQQSSSPAAQTAVMNADSIHDYIRALEAKVEKLREEASNANRRAVAAEQRAGTAEQRIASALSWFTGEKNLELNEVSE